MTLSTIKLVWVRHTRGIPVEASWLKMVMLSRSSTQRLPRSFTSWSFPVTDLAAYPHLLHASTGNLHRHGAIHRGSAFPSIGWVPCQHALDRAGSMRTSDVRPFSPHSLPSCPTSTRRGPTQNVFETVKYLIVVGDYGYSQNCRTDTFPTVCGSGGSAAAPATSGDNNQNVLGNHAVDNGAVDHGNTLRGQSA